MPHYARCLRATGKPVLYAFCNRDPLLYEEDNIKYAANFGVKDFDVYDANAEPVTMGK